MPAAGDVISVPTVPGSRIATTIATTNSADITAESAVMSVTGPLLPGRVYRVRLAAGVGGQTGDRLVLRIREDSLGGTQLQGQQAFISQGTTGAYASDIEVEYTSVGSGSKTFVATMQLINGTGPVRLDADGSQPSYFYIDFIRDAS
jgi:hypothetical protein